jgi:hypothetical protein
MADIYSRIILQASGGDQVAREIQKIQTAYQTVGSAANNLGLKNHPTLYDAYGRAVSSPETTQTALVRKEWNDVEQAKASERESSTRSLSRDSYFGNQMRNVTNTSRSLLPAIQGGDPLAAASSAAGGIGGMLSGAGGALAKASPYLMAAAVITAGASMLAGKESERIKALWGSGTSQRLGMGYEQARTLSIDEMRKGTPKQMVMESLQAFGSSGGKVIADVFSENLKRMQNYGISGEAGMGLSATLQRAGGSGLIDRSTYQILDKAFGAGRLSPMFQSLGKIIEESLARGSKAASLTLGGGVVSAAAAISKQIAGLAQFGGLSMEGAVSTYEQTQNLGRNAANLSTPMDVATFRAFRQPGESIFASRLRMEQDPQAVLKRQMEMVEARYGGNEDMMKEAIFRSGYSPSQANAIFENYAAQKAGKDVAHAPFEGEGRRGDKEARLSTQVEQMQVLAGVEKEILEFRNNVAVFAKQLLAGDLNPPKGSLEQGERLATGIMTNTSVLRDIQTGNLQGYENIVKAVNALKTESTPEELMKKGEYSQAAQKAILRGR